MQLLLSHEGNSEVVESRWQYVLEDLATDAESTQPVLAEVPESEKVVLSLAQYLQEPSAWPVTDDRWTVVIQPADELADLPVELLDRAEILVLFPVFTDGRGYSHAATLKQHYAYGGVLVAVGDIRRDQLEFMRETGFTAFEITGNDSIDSMLVSLTELDMPPHRLYSGAAISAEGGLGS